MYETQPHVYVYTEISEIVIENEETLVVLEPEIAQLVIEYEMNQVLISSEGLQGPPGPPGPPGRNIVSVIRTDGDGSPGSYDTYTISYSDGTNTTFTIYNGKDGDGSGDWVDLQEHINDPTPHPAYDDMTSLVLRFENGLV